MINIFLNYFSLIYINNVKFSKSNKSNYNVMVYHRISVYLHFTARAVYMTSRAKIFQRHIFIFTILSIYEADFVHFISCIFFKEKKRNMSGGFFFIEPPKRERKVYIRAQYFIVLLFRRPFLLLSLVLWKCLSSRYPFDI